MHFHRRRLSLSPVPVPYRFLSRRRLHRRMVLELPVFMGTTSDRPVASTFGEGAAFPAYLANARGLVPDVVDRSPHLLRRLASQVNRQVDAEASAAHDTLYKPRYNVAHADIGWVVSYAAGRRILHPARWKYLIGANRPLMNIRSESVQFPRFRDVFTSNRCAVVTDGFFLWPGDDLNPVWLHMADDGLVLLGGLLQRSRSTTGFPRFSVLTTQASGKLAKFHDRMPVIIELGQLGDWLTAAPEAALKMRAPAPTRGLLATRVSDYVNSVKHDDPGCIAPPSYEQ
jgi:putative SOS response-associated peptidase YedK